MKTKLWTSILLISLPLTTFATIPTPLENQTNSTTQIQNDLTHLQPVGIKAHFLYCMKIPNTDGKLS